MDLAELWAIFGPGFSGAVFGTGWWFWVDAVVCSSIQVPFVHYLPGIFASLGALMFNCVRKEDIDYSPYDEGEWRLKLWLFIAYVVAFVSPSCFCWLADSRFGRKDWAFDLDWCGWCFSMCVCIDKWANVLDITLRVSRRTGTYFISDSDTCCDNVEVPLFFSTL